jgi:hypothetical protein
VIAASMEEVELFLAPLPARSKVREVLRGLVATRQVHTISLGHAPHFYVAGTLPEFEPPPTIYASSSMPASAYFLRSRDHEEDMPEFEAPQHLSSASPTAMETRRSVEPHAPRTAATRKPAASGKSAAARPHFSRPVTHSRDRKPAQSSAGSRPSRRTTPEARSAGARPAGARPANGSRPASAGARRNASSSASSQFKGKHNGARANTGSNNGARPDGSATRPANGGSGARAGRSAAPVWGQRNSHANGGKAAGKPGASTRSSAARSGSSTREDSRADARSARTDRKPALAAGTKVGNSKRFGFTARPKQGMKKRG